MTPEAMRVAIAEACGIRWKEEFVYGEDVSSEKWFRITFPDGRECCSISVSIKLPDYPNDLNACAEMRKCVPEGKRAEYALTLGEICGKSGDMGWGEADAKPEQHCETFLRVMNLWKENE